MRNLDVVFILYFRFCSFVLHFVQCTTLYIFVLLWNVIQCRLIIMLAIKPRFNIMANCFIFSSRTWKTKKETIWHMISSYVPPNFFECPFTFLINKKCQIESLKTRKNECSFCIAYSFISLRSTFIISRCRKGRISISIDKSFIDIE